MKRKKKATSLLETLMEYDSEVKKVGGAEGGGGMMSRLLKKSSAGVNTAEKVKHEIESVIKSKSPGFAKIALNFGADLMERPIKEIARAFKAFDNQVASKVDVDMPELCRYRLLASMTKQSFGSALKGFLGGLTGGERHIGVGMSGAPR